MDTEKIRIFDLHDNVIDRVCNSIEKYSVGLCRIVRKDNKEKAFILVGSGTLVFVGTFHCILTADHVAKQFRDSDLLSLLISFTGEIERHTFEFSHLGIYKIARGENYAVGPDIGLIVLPQNQIGWLKAKKSFYNIDKRRERFRETLIDKDRGFWFTLGILGESEKPQGKTNNFSSVKRYRGLCGSAGNPSENEFAGFDYIEMGVNYHAPNSELPKSFGGCSGAGLWQVPMRKNIEGQIEEEEYILSGLVFYETGIEDEVRHIRCHGKKVIYRVVPKFMEQF